MIPSLSSVDAKSIEELSNLVAKQTKEIQFLFEGNIDADNIRANSITANLIQAGAIISTSIADGSITNSKIASGAIDNSQIIDSTIQGIKLQAGTLTDTQIANLAITGSKIANTTITGNKIVTGTITADKLTVSQLSAITANLGAVTAGTIDGVVITGGTVRTASSGARIELSSNKLRAFDSSNNQTASIDATSVTPTFSLGSIQIVSDQYSGVEHSIYFGGGSTYAKVTRGGTGYSNQLEVWDNRQVKIWVSSSANIVVSSTSVDILGLSSSSIPSHTQAWSSITGTPTTLSGYGVTSVSWSLLTGTPTTLSGYSISDAYTKTYIDANFAAKVHTHAWSDITSGKPTTLSGYGITDAYTKTTSDGKYGGNLVYNSTTKLLKLFAPDGTQLASVDISGS